MMPQYIRNELGLYVPVSAVVPARKQWVAVDLFCGCGGFSVGLESAGVDVVAALDSWPCAAINYLYNLGHRNGCAVGYVDDDVDRKAFYKELKKSGFSPDDQWIGGNPHRPQTDRGCRAMLVGDATKASGADILALLAANHWEGEIDLVVGGPPCQGMSLANSKRSETDPRNNLVLEFVRLAHELDAPMFIMENVPPLLEDKKFLDLRTALFDRANDAGYTTISANIIDAVGYGVPQYRRRAIIVGQRPGVPQFHFPMPTHFGLVMRDGKVSCDHISRRQDETGSVKQMEMF